MTKPEFFDLIVTAVTHLHQSSLHQSSELGAAIEDVSTDGDHKSASMIVRIRSQLTAWDRRRMQDSLRELSYQEHLQKPDAIAFYRKHITHLETTLREEAEQTFMLSSIHVKEIDKEGNEIK